LDAQYFSVMPIVIILATAGFFLAFPRIARRGLLFGVYVGEEVAAGEPARQLVARWTRSILAWTVVAFVANALLARPSGAVPAYVAGLLVLVVGAYVQYFRCYRAALALAPSAAAPPPAVAYVGSVPRPWPAYVAFTISLVAGAVSLAYTWLHLAELPAEMPVHFGFSGRPDAFRPTTFASVWMLPLLTLVIGGTLAGTALLVAHAKRAVRRGDEGRSLAAQERFRAATTVVLALSALLTSVLLATTSIGAVRIAIGAAEALPAFVPALTLVLIAVALGGSGFLALRYGQGGARLEAPVATPLTNGLADNSRWALGMFYFDPQDPSIFVEKRFGIGYTLNFGNWKAVVGLVLFLAFVIFGPSFLR
jgi:uncharacterized membrane protein